MRRILEKTAAGLESLDGLKLEGDLIFKTSWF